LCKYIDEFNDQVFYCGLAVFRELFLHAVGHDGIYGKAIMTEQLAETIDGRGLHLEIGDPVLAETEIREAVHQVGVADAEAEDASLRAIEAWAGNGDPAVEAADEVLEQGAGRAADIGVAHLTMQLRMGNEGMQ